LVVISSVYSCAGSVIRSVTSNDWPSRSFAYTSAQPMEIPISKVVALALCEQEAKVGFTLKPGSVESTTLRSTRQNATFGDSLTTVPPELIRR
jgi:hypothetical protein